jgi:hypothetical protein
VKLPRDVEDLRAPDFLTISAGVYCAIARDLKHPHHACTWAGVAGLPSKGTGAAAEDRGNLVCDVLVQTPYSRTYPVVHALMIGYSAMRIFRNRFV